MTPPSREGPPRWGDAAGSSKGICLSASPSGTPSSQKDQAQIERDPRAGRAPHLRLVPPAPPPRPRHLAVRITAFDGRVPIGRTRAIRLTPDDAKRLIDAALRLEATRA
jgi:hypothetical protein